MKKNDCSIHTVIVHDGSGQVKTTHNFKQSSSLSCMNGSGYKYVDLTGNILHTNLYDFEHHDESQHLSGGNTIYKATEKPACSTLNLQNIVPHLSPDTCEHWEAGRADECKNGYSCAYKDSAGKSVCKQCTCTPTPWVGGVGGPCNTAVQHECSASPTWTCTDPPGSTTPPPAPVPTTPAPTPYCAEGALYNCGPTCEEACNTDPAGASCSSDAQCTKTGDKCWGCCNGPPGTIRCPV